MKLLGLVGLLVAFIGSTFARVPAHLAGTDIFPYEGTTINVSRGKFDAEGKAILEGGRQVREAVSVELPLGALNLASGAEFFTVMAQQLYKYADLIEVVTADVDFPTAAGAAAPAAPVAPVRGGRRVHRYIVDPWTKSLKKKEDVNPIAVLLRVLFKQVDGTTGLADFRVSTLATSKDGFNATLADWADIIVATLAIYKVRVECVKQQELVGALRKILPSKNSLINAYNAFEMQPEKPSFGLALAVSITWGDAAGVGSDLVLRMLMGGVYALCGHDQKAIKFFYAELLKKLEKQKIILADVLAEARARFTDVWGERPVQDSATRAGVAETKDPEPADGTGVPEAYTAGAAVDSPSYTAYQMLKNISGAFSVLAYDVARVGSATYPDCFETTMRNIVRGLVAGVSDLGVKMHEDYAAYFTAYSTEALQATQKARDAWASLVSAIPGILYTANKPELNVSLMNLLVGLNYIFHLKVPALDAITDENPVTISNELDPDREELLRDLVASVNNALRDKLSKDVEIEVDSYEDVISHKISLTRFQAGDIIMTGYLHVGQHAEINMQLEDRPPITVPEGHANIFMALEAAVNDEYARPDGTVKTRQDAHMALVTLSSESNLLASLLTQSLAPALMDVVLNAVKQIPDPRQVGVLMIGLVSRGYAFKQAADIAAQALKSTDWTVFVQGFNLYHKLIEKEKYFEQALALAVASVKSPVLTIRSQGFRLIEKLVLKGYGFDDAAVIARDSVLSSDSVVLSEGFRLYGNLAEKGQQLEVAAELVGESIKSSDQLVLSAAFTLLQKLVEVGYEFDLAATIAADAVKSTDPRVRRLGLLVYIELVKKNREVETAALIAAETLEKDYSHSEKNAAVFLQEVISSHTALSDRARAGAG